MAKIDALYAGRAYAAYGGVYIVASLGRLWVIEGTRPDRWDLVGAVVVLGGAAIISAAALKSIIHQNEYYQDHE